MSEDDQTLGDRMKAQEQIEAGRKCDNTLPLIARLDGRAFHTFTRGLERPYDVRLSNLMAETTKFLVRKTQARLGYCQSDEITLFWYNAPPKSDRRSYSEYMFGGKYQKLTSILAGLASAYFSREVVTVLPEKAEYLPVFDCRVWNVSSLHEVYANFLWRQNDAIKNSVSMLAQSHFSHAELQGKNSMEMKAMLKARGIEWHKEPEFFRVGSFFAKCNRFVKLSDDDLTAIPEHCRPPEGLVMRSFIERLDIERISYSDIETFATNQGN